MRLWHKDLIPYLPNSQLLSQKRECDFIWKDRHKGKQTNHILINYIWQYDVDDLLSYYYLLQKEFERRGFKFNNKSNFGAFCYIEPFQDHHTELYLTICYYNLKEKYLRGQKDFTKEVWDKLDEFYKKEMLKDVKN